MFPYRAYTLNGHCAAMEIGTAINLLQTGAHPLHDSERCGWRRVSWSAPRLGNGDHVLGFHTYYLHIAQVGADIGACQEQTSQTVHETPQDAEHSFGLISFGITYDDAFSPSKVSACRGPFIRHATRQAQCVLDSVVFCLIMPHTDATTGRSQGSIVNSKDRLQAETFILAEEEVFIVILLHRLENKAFHSRDFILRLLNRFNSLILNQYFRWRDRTSGQSFKSRRQDERFEITIRQDTDAPFKTHTVLHQLESCAATGAFEAGVIQVVHAPHFLR